MASSGATPLPDPARDDGTSTGRAATSPNWASSPAEPTTIAFLTSSGTRGRLPFVGTLQSSSTTSMPLSTSPKTVYLPSRCGDVVNKIENDEQPLSGSPSRWAIDK